MMFTVLRCSPAPVLAVFVGILAFPAFAQDEDPLNRGEVRRALELAEEKEEDAEDAFEDGDQEAARTAWGEAGGFYLRVLQDHPWRRDLRLRLGRIYTRFEEWENVAGAFEAALETDPPPEEADVDGWAFENVEDAGEILEAWTGLANAYSHLEDDLKVIEAGRKVIELDPNPPVDIYLGLGASMARQGRFEEASEMAGQALEMAPDSAVAHSTLGQAAAAAGDWETAEASYRRAVELDPDIARAHAGLAQIHFARDDFESAVASATEALSRNDQLTAAYGIRGLANNALGNQQEAYGDLAMAITVNAEDPAANLAFAQVYEAQGNASQAKTYYQKVTTLANAPPMSQAAAHAALGRFSITERAFDEAVEHMRMALDADPSSEEARNGLALANYSDAKAKRQQQDLAGALEAARAAVEGDPENPLYKVEYGIALVVNQSPAEAAPLLESAIPAYPADGDPADLGMGHWALGQAYLGSNNFSGAETHFSEAAQRIDSWGEPFRNLAWAHVAQIQYGACRLKDAAFGERLQAAGVGCPASEADYALVDAAWSEYQKAMERGVEDPTLAARLEVLREVRNQLVE